VSLSLSCQQARALVSDYINRELDEDLARTLERHLETCPTCPPLYASLVALRRRLAGMSAVASQPSVRARILWQMRRAVTDAP
jgi:anti-sigma factor RsiW